MRLVALKNGSLLHRLIRWLSRFAPLIAIHPDAGEAITEARIAAETGTRLRVPAFGRPVYVRGTTRLLCRLQALPPSGESDDLRFLAYIDELNPQTNLYYRPLSILRLLRFLDRKRGWRAAFFIHDGSSRSKTICRLLAAALRDAGSPSPAGSILPPPNDETERLRRVDLCRRLRRELDRPLPRGRFDCAVVEWANATPRVSPYALVYAGESEGLDNPAAAIPRKLLVLNPIDWLEPFDAIASAWLARPEEIVFVDELFDSVLAGEMAERIRGEKEAFLRRDTERKRDRPFLRLAQALLPVIDDGSKEAWAVRFAALGPGLADAGIAVSAVVWSYENQLWERYMMRGLRLSLPGARLVAPCSRRLPEFWSYPVSPSQRKANAIPDRLLLLDAASVDRARRAGLPDDRVVLVP